MEYLPDELVLIGYEKRIYIQCSLRKPVVKEEEERVLDRFSCSGGPNGPTELAQIEWRLMWMNRHSRWTWNQLQTNMLVVLCRGCRGPGFFLHGRGFYYVFDTMVESHCVRYEKTNLTLTLTLSDSTTHRPLVRTFPFVSYTVCANHNCRIRGELFCCVGPNTLFSIRTFERSRTASYRSAHCHALWRRFLNG